MIGPHKLFRTTLEAVVWIAVPLLLAAGGVAAIVAGPRPAVITALALLVATTYIVFRKVDDRLDWLSSIIFVTKQGVAVSLGLDQSWRKRVFSYWVDRVRLQMEIELMLSDAIHKWADFDTRLHADELIRVRLRGAWLVILPSVWGGGKRYMGLADGKDMVVAWDELRNPGTAGLRAIVMHEVSHVAQSALGYADDEDKQHARMAEMGIR